MEEVELDNVLDLVDDAFWNQVGIYKSNEEYRVELRLKIWVKHELDPLFISNVLDETLFRPQLKRGEIEGFSMDTRSIKIINNLFEVEVTRGLRVSHLPK
jgi:hypothetical protein